MFSSVTWKIRSAVNFLNNYYSVRYGEGRLPFGNRPSWVQGLDLNQGLLGYDPS